MVFVSYSSTEFSVAKKVVSILTDDGISCWIAPDSISAGGDYADEIPDAIENCDAFLLILSRASQASKWVPKELDVAITHGKMILPFQIEKMELDRSISFRLTNVQIIDASDDINKSARFLIRKLRGRSLPDVPEDMESALPDQYSYFQLLHVHNIKDLDIKKIRGMHDVSKSLEVPVGINTAHEIVTLDFHHKGDGPNGLIIGPSGSGKTEFLSTLCLSLCLFFSPKDVQIKLIDFKYGFSYQELSDLPHIVMETAHHDDDMHTLYDVIEQELKKRYKILEEYEVSNIYQYLTLRKKSQNKAMPEMPHLFIIYDEYAFVKREYPEFDHKLREWGSGMNSVLIGIHLIYSTQYADGMVDDALWRLSKFKICSIMQRDECISETELECIERHPGRFYLQTQAQEDVQVVQMAFSNVPIESNRGKAKIAHNYSWFFGNQTERRSVINRIVRYEIE